MKLFLFGLTLLTFTTASCQSTCDKCDLAKVKAINEQIDNLTPSLIRNFLCTFDKSCSNNAEFSSWSNETLFKVLDKAPKVFFQVITDKDINTDILLKEIENPIDDLINLQLLYDKLKTTTAPADIKTKYLKSLEVALSKTDNLTLDGVWVVDKYVFANISGMDDTIAAQWMGKKAIINEQLSFEYSEIPNYASIFKGNKNCDFRTQQKKERVDTDKYFSNDINIAHRLGILQKEILIIQTKCKETPFQEIIKLTSNQIIIRWDGTFFFLTKEQ